jgi:putative sigma-54 modulation protein
MKIQVKGRNIAVTDSLQDYAEEKLARVNRLLLERKIEQVSRLELELMVEKNPANPNSNVAEATIFTRGPVIRAKESSDDMYAAIDLVTDKMLRRVRKYHDKIHGKNHHKRPAMPDTLPVPEEEAELQLQKAVGVLPAGEEPEVEEELLDGRLVKHKRFEIKPMTVEEAALQMELVGHDFFVFLNVDSNDTNVVYRRRDGHYGLIEPIR